MAIESGVIGTSATLSGLSNGSSYYFLVVAMNAGGSAPASNEASATPSAPAKGGGAMDWAMLALLLGAVTRRVLAAR